MIGREGELRLVDSFLHAGGPGTHALLLQGEAGIGKTTIWQAALSATYRALGIRARGELGAALAADGDRPRDSARRSRESTPS